MSPATLDAHSMFEAGKHVSFSSSDTTLTFVIEKPFTPFTKSIVLLVRSDELGPDPVVLKIYDPRFLDERVSPVASQPSHPWTLAAERAAAALPLDAFDENLLWEDEPAADDAQGQLERAALWEEHFRRLLTDCYESEWKAYDNLRVFQGSAIPRLLFTGTFLPPDERAIRLPAIVLEYIPEALSLRDVSDANLLDEAMCTTLVSAIDSFPSHGVFHGDINENNILFTPRQRPQRAVVIDFGCAGIRTADEDEESWQFNVNFANDGRRARQLLQGKGVYSVDVPPAA